LASTNGPSITLSSPSRCGRAPGESGISAIVEHAPGLESRGRELVHRLQQSGEGWAGLGDVTIYMKRI